MRDKNEVAISLLNRAAEAMARERSMEMYCFMPFVLVAWRFLRDYNTVARANNLRSIAFLALLAPCTQQQNLGGQYYPETPTQFAAFDPSAGVGSNIDEAAVIHRDKQVGF